MSFNEKLSYTEHVVVSPTTDFAIGFVDYGLPSDTINVFVDDVLATDAGYTVIRKNNMVVELQPAVASGVVRLQRATNLDASFYRFTAGAKFVAANIDANFNQILHSQQETRDGFDKLAGDVYPLVNGLEVALSKADEASKAAQEAADAAEEAAQVTRSASQVIDASGETQQQVNYNGGSKWHSRVDGYKLNERVVLANGDIVKSTIDGNTNNPNLDMAGWVLESSKNVSNPSDLAALQNPKNKQRVYVEALQKTFVYDVNLSIPENGVTVVGKWEMELQDVYYASLFALPDLGDMSEQIKVGYEYATSKKRTFIVDANFNVRSNQAIQGSPLFTAVNVLSNSHMYFLPQGKFTLITDSEDNSNIICAKDVDNYIITKPKLVGDRLTNASTIGTREWGYGLTIYTSSNGYIFEPDIKNCMGDGLYIGKSWAYATDNVPTNITVVRPKIDRVRRNGISLTSGKNVFVDSPIVSNVTTIDGITPTEPASGLDIEPESAPDSPIARLENCIIHNPTFINCDKAINFWNQAVGSFMDVRITGETNIHNDSITHTGLWMRNERACAAGSRLHIDKVVFNSKLDQPVLAFIYETSNVDVVIGEMVNNCNQNLDFVYAPVDGAQVFGKFKVGKLSTTNQNFGFTVVYNSLNSGCTTGLRIENVDCLLGAYNLNSTTKMNKTSRYFVNSKAYVFNSMKTNELISSVLQFESYGVSTPTLDTTDDLSLIKIGLSPTSPKSNPLSVPNLRILYEGGVYSKITLSSGASMSMKRVGNTTEIYELSYGGVIVDPIIV